MQHLRYKQGRAQSETESSRNINVMKPENDNELR